MLPAIAIFDIGRTNKKFILFDKQYNVVKETAITIPDITDDEREICENINAIISWIEKCMKDVMDEKKIEIRAVNFSTHGAALVHIDEKGDILTPMYDYLKPIEKSMQDDFYMMFGGEEKFSQETGSPALGMLNSGIQLFWLKKKKPFIFKKIKYSLHLPQYLNYLFTNKTKTDITSVGCHTGLWNFKKNEYHSWLKEERVLSLLPPPVSPGTSDEGKFGGQKFQVGVGIHDSSAALLPFFYESDEPFVLLSSGTWNICMNPFFTGSLSDEKFNKDCLYYLLDVKKKVAASRLFLGNEYQYQVQNLQMRYSKPSSFYKQVQPDENIFMQVIKNQSSDTFFYPVTMKNSGPFPNLKSENHNHPFFKSFEEAYHKLMMDLVYLQKISINLISEGVKRLLVTGGFAHNQFFMELMQAFLPDWNICIAENPRASALGAALAIHHSWQKDRLPKVSHIVPFKAQLNLDLSQYIFYLEESKTSKIS